MPTIPGLFRRDLLAAGAAAAAGSVAFPAAPRAASEGTLLVAHEENAPPMVALLNETAVAFEQAHPGTHVRQLFLENAAYKAKLTTMLQSSDRPDIIYSWGRGTLDAQVNAGVIADVTAVVNGWHEVFQPVALEAFRIDDRLYGAPFVVSGVGFFCNRALFRHAGVAIEELQSWPDLTGAVAKLKAAGIVPITVGGGEKWPLHFYFAFLALRIGGRGAFDAARAGRNGGFGAPCFVEAGRLLQELARSGAFQPGFAGALAPESYGDFGDGHAAMILMGNWITTAQRANAADGKGVAAGDLAYLRFPTVPGGTGDTRATFGGVNGWVKTRSAPPAADALLHDLAGPAFERALAVRDIYIPALKGMSGMLTDPVLRQVAADIENSTFHLLFLDQTLGPSLGAVVNDISLGLATGALTPQAAAAQLEQARQAEDL